ncbi:hypothetical protein C8R43DRAFT_305663 [Mycena crocata]|nr:hypothetical protein C8R43DRAFT_305663 [Mycena crocata]
MSFATTYDFGTRVIVSSLIAVLCASPSRLYRAPSRLYRVQLDARHRVGSALLLGIRAFPYGKVIIWRNIINQGCSTRWEPCVQQRALSTGAMPSRSISTQPGPSKDSRIGLPGSTPRRTLRTPIMTLSWEAISRACAVSNIRTATCTGYRISAEWQTAAFQDMSLPSLLGCVASITTFCKGEIY